MPGEIWFETRNNPRMQPMREGKIQVKRKATPERNEPALPSRRGEPGKPEESDCKFDREYKSRRRKTQHTLTVRLQRKILDIESESRLGHRKVPVVQDYFTEWLQGCPTKKRRRNSRGSTMVLAAASKARENSHRRFKRVRKIVQRLRMAARCEHAAPFGDEWFHREGGAPCQKTAQQRL